MNEKKSIDKLLESLQERAKELNCLYQIEEVLGNQYEPIEEICNEIINVIPSGLLYPDFCRTKITLDSAAYQSPDYRELPGKYSEDIVIQDMIIGTISVCYAGEVPPRDFGPFLKEETRLIKTIADRLGHFIMHQMMHRISQDLQSSHRETSYGRHGKWQIILEMLRQTDSSLYLRISRKILNYLCWSGVAEAESLMQTFNVEVYGAGGDIQEAWNRPLQKGLLDPYAEFSSAAFDIAASHLSEEDINRLVQKWLQEDKLNYLVQAVNRNLSLADVSDAIRRCYRLVADELVTPSPSKRGIQVSLIRRFLSDQLQYVNVAKDYIGVRDFYHLLGHVIYTSESQGKLGGKSAGLYFAAQILKNKGKDSELLRNIKIPKTWHITSDVLVYFMHYNDLEEVVEQKYKDINQIRIEYPHIVQTFKRSRFPADIVQGLSVALDDFGDVPIIVRSSSLLEDRVGTSFSGKYKSLFLANQGSKQKRLEDLMDAIAEVYASTFSPDPIEYRAERGLLDFGEEMGIMIQEVVGTRIGKYFLPSYAGVAFSRNEFRWSPRIKREDGLVRLVPGMGTRAVDRLSDDYPVLIAPGQPGLRVNINPDEVARYSPKKIDVIDLEKNGFESIDLATFLKLFGYEMPAIDNIISIFKDDHLGKPMGMNIDFENGELVANFEGLITRTPFVKKMHAILATLEETMGHPVDIEFASNGQDLYLLQCRSQSYSGQSMPTPIPKDIPRGNIIFTARRYVSNGRVPDITHIVYVNPDAYANTADYSRMMAIGRAVGKLNLVLPKRQFILMGPGRWGSRGDIKLGVNVTYSDINNTAALIEIARKKGNYIPDYHSGHISSKTLSRRTSAICRYIPMMPILFSMSHFCNAVPTFCVMFFRNMRIWMIPYGLLMLPSVQAVLSLRC